MGTRRLGIALIAALVISLGITSIFYVRITRTQAASRPKTRRIVAAAIALQPGTPITAENLTDIDWPLNVPLDGLIEKKEDVAGHVLMYAVATNQPVLRRDLAASASLGLSAKIPDGMRATAVKTNEVMNIAGFIFPGSHVDVLVTLKPENNTASTETRTVLLAVKGRRQRTQLCRHAVTSPVQESFPMKGVCSGMRDDVHRSRGSQLR